MASFISLHYWVGRCHFWDFTHCTVGCPFTAAYVCFPWPGGRSAAGVLLYSQPVGSAALLGKLNAAFYQGISLTLLWIGFGDNLRMVVVKMFLLITSVLWLSCFAVTWSVLSCFNYKAGWWSVASVHVKKYLSLNIIHLTQLMWQILAYAWFA